MKILVVAPESRGINPIQEVSAISWGGEVRVLSGVVSRRDLESALLSEKWDVVHFAQHGDDYVLELSDGAVTLEWLVRRLRAVADHLKLIFLNTCNSALMGVAIHNMLGVPVIAFDGEVSDSIASRFAQDVYGSLRSGATVAVAFEEALGSIQRIFPDHQVRPVLVNGNHDICITDLSRRIDKMEKEIEEIRYVISDRAYERWAIFAILIMQAITLAFNFIR
jgi:hypothetical protein